MQKGSYVFLSFGMVNLSDYFIFLNGFIGEMNFGFLYFLTFRIKDLFLNLT